jgi:REP element-mobilizing transposase RayT
MENEMFRRRHLPHWDVPGAFYFVTGCLEGSVPAQGLLELVRHRAALKKLPKPPDRTAADWETELWKRKFARLDDWLDMRPANSALADPELAKFVVDSMYFFAGQRYDLSAYVVMPSHFHWLFRPREEWTSTIDCTKRSARTRIMYSLRRWTANRCNRARNANGHFWQIESYDHWVRDLDAFERIICYIEGNPVKAGLVAKPADWKFSSAFDRRLLDIPAGLPLVRQVQTQLV